MATSESIVEIKSYIYGVGRGCGIGVTPRHHAGEPTEQIRSLARDVIFAAVRPSNEILGEECAVAFERLSNAVHSGAESNAIHDALRHYVGARQRELSRGAVE
jgi:hypothetical protein